MKKPLYFIELIYLEARWLCQNKKLCSLFFKKHTLYWCSRYNNRTMQECNKAGGHEVRQKGFQVFHLNSSYTEYEI